MGELARRVGREVADAVLREVQVADRARNKLVRRHEKAVARHESLLARARTRLPVAAVTAVGSAALAVPLTDGWFLLTAAAAAVAVRSAATLRRPPPRPQLPPEAVPRPAAGTAAHDAVQRLDAARASLLRLGPLVGRAGRDAADEALRAGADADTALRWQAARLDAVAPHRGTDPTALQGLLDGVACQEQLVAGMADLVAAGDEAGQPDLREATDRLHGLADGLRRLR